MRRIVFIISILCISFNSIAQPASYSVANAHSHNDYENPVPFYTAYNEHFGSIEADIFLQKDELVVAHDMKEVLMHRTLEQLYLEPLAAAVQKNNGFAYADTNRQLQMLIDIKTDAATTLKKLIEILKQFPVLINNRSIKWVITGNRPDQSEFVSYPSFILFDGELYKEYTQEALTKIVMLSDDFKNYSHWDGKGNIPAPEEAKLTEAINKAHHLHKAVRFWDAPDNVEAWMQFMKFGVDYINTDHITSLSMFLSARYG